ncbi:MAG: hypothetical protein IJN78_06795 [Clostridia bacterium]|nr:hypothetical protein [Clostridia bacterium]
MNKHDELVLKLIAEEMLEEDDEIFMKEVEEAKNDPAFANTDISRKKMEKVIADELKKLKKNKKRKNKTFMRVASILLVLLIGFSATTLTVKGFREKVWAFIMNIGNTSHSSVISSDDDYSSALDSYEGKYIPTWIPEGYEVSDIKNTINIHSITFKNSSGNIITYFEHQKNYETKVNLDKEIYDSYETKTIANKETIIALKDNTTTLAIKETDALIIVTLNDPTININGFIELIVKK